MISGCTTKLEKEDKLMISKLRFSLVAVIMLVLFGFGFQDQARGQIGDDGVLCPGLPQTTGWVKTSILGPSPLNVPPDFTAGWLGTVENFGGDVIAGGDWKHRDFPPLFSYTPTNEAGSQLVAWWTQKEGRNSYLQVTNAIDEFASVHVRIINGETCGEIRNFCDSYTPFDTHVYNFGDLVANTGQDVDESVLQGREGYVVVTAVDDCPSPDRAFEHNYLVGTFYVLDTADYLYGSATYMRQGICFDEEFTFDENRVFDGSFQSGEFGFGNWELEQGNGGVITALGISPPLPVNPVPGDYVPDADDPGSDVFQAFLASSYIDTSLFYMGGSFPNLADNTLINTGSFETNVSVVESAVFSTNQGGTAFYQAQFLAPGEELMCDNYLAACVIDPDAVPPVFVDCECFNQTGGGNIIGNGCSMVVGDAQGRAIGPYDFLGGKSSLINGSLQIPGPGNWVIQFITGMIADDGECQFAGEGDTNPNTGAIIDNVRFIETVTEFLVCDGVLDGAPNAFLDVVVPNNLAGQFNVQYGNPVAGADAVLINFWDDYGPPYRPLGTFVDISVSIYDDVENFTSCGEASVCFARLGIDANVINSDDFTPVVPTTIVPPPTLGPTTTPPTTIPTTESPSGGNGSCAIAGNPVQLGTAMANVLIPLIPVAFVFGIRAIRRRKK